MQEQSIKILRTKKNELMLFSHSDTNNSIVFKKYENTRWSYPQSIITNVDPFFSLCVSDDERIFILCRDKNGNIYLCRSDNDMLWESKVLLQNQREESIFSRFFISFNNNTLSLIYNIPSRESKVHYLMNTSFVKGEWSEPEKIDEFIPFDKNPYIINCIKDNHIILYFKTSESTVNSREMLLSPTTLGNLNGIIQTSQICTDISILTTSEKIHILYTTRGMFSSQLVYKSKSEAKISTPRVIWEGQRCEGCILFKIKSRLWIMWISGGIVFYTISDDNGITFENPLRYKGEFCRHPTKVEYIDNCTFDGAEISEIYVDKENNNEIMIIPDLYSGFYSQNAQTQTLSQSSNNNYSSSDEGQRLKNKLALCEAQISEANTNIIQLSKSLAERGEEISIANAQWSSRYRALKQENEKLLSLISDLKSELDILQNPHNYTETAFDEMCIKETTEID